MAHLTVTHFPAPGLKPAVSPICQRRRTNQQVIVKRFTTRGLQVRDPIDSKPALRGRGADAPDETGRVISD